MAERKAVLLRLEPALHEALQRWAGDEIRSVNAQLEFLVREALRRAGRIPVDRRGNADTAETGGP